MDRMAKRMWTRRMIRAGWLLAPVLAFPTKVFSFCFGSRDRFLWTLLAFGVILAVGSCENHSRKMDAEATPEQIKAALTGNPCMIDLMPRRQADYGRPLQVRDLVKGDTDCKEFHENLRKIAVQKSAMEALKAK